MHGFYGSVVVIVIGSSRVIRRARVRISAYHWAPSARLVSRHCNGRGARNLYGLIIAHHSGRSCVVNRDSFFFCRGRIRRYSATRISLPPQKKTIGLARRKGLARQLTQKSDNL